MLSIEIQLFGLRRTNNKKLFVSLPKADDTSQEAAPNLQSSQINDIKTRLESNEKEN